MFIVKFKYPGRRRTGIVMNEGIVRQFATRESAEYYADTLNSMIMPELKSKFPIWYASKLSDNNENFVSINNDIKEASIG